MILYVYAEPQNALRYGHREENQYCTHFSPRVETNLAMSVLDRLVINQHVKDQQSSTHFVLGPEHGFLSLLRKIAHEENQITNGTKMPKPETSLVASMFQSVSYPGWPEWWPFSSMIPQQHFTPVSEIKYFWQIVLYCTYCLSWRSFVKLIISVLLLLHV